MTQAVQVVTPVGIIETRDVPASATGPSLLELLIGSEGPAASSPQATMRICPRPGGAGLSGLPLPPAGECHRRCCDLMQEAPLPHHRPPLRSGRDRRFRRPGPRPLRPAGASWIGPPTGTWPGSGHSPAGGSCFLLLGYDGRPADIRPRWRRATEICRDHGRPAPGPPRRRILETGTVRLAVPAGYAPGRRRYGGYPGDGHHLVQPAPLYEAMTAAIRAAIRDTGGGPGYVMTHVSHSYPWGPRSTPPSWAVSARRGD